MQDYKETGSWEIPHAGNFYITKDKRGYQVWHDGCAIGGGPRKTVQSCVIYIEEEILESLKRKQSKLRLDLDIIGEILKASGETELWLNRFFE